METGFDVCNLIRSDEIKKYYQEQVVVSLDEKIAIVLSSYKSLQDKIKALKSLHEEIGVYKHEEIQNLISLYEERNIIFYNPYKIYPECKAAYLVDELIWKCNDLADINMHDVMKQQRRNCGQFKSIDEVLRFFDKSEKDSLYEVKVHVLDKESSDGRTITYSVGCIDSKYVPFMAWDDDSAEEIYDDFTLRNSLPYESGSRLCFQLPGMNKAITGFLWSEQDKNGCWYHFLLSDNAYENGSVDDFLDISYKKIGVTSDFSVLDWIRRLL